MPRNPPYFIADGPAELVRLNIEDARLNEDLRVLCRAASENTLFIYLDKTDILYPNLREIIQDEIDRKRWDHIATKVEPHWTLTPNFSVTVVGMIAAIIAAVAGVRSCRDEEIDSRPVPLIQAQVAHSPDTNTPPPLLTPPPTAKESTDAAPASASPKK